GAGSAGWAWAEPAAIPRATRIPATASTQVMAASPLRRQSGGPGLPVGSRAAPVRAGTAGLAGAAERRIGGLLAGGWPMSVLTREAAAAYGVAEMTSVTPMARHVDG